MLSVFPSLLKGFDWRIPSSIVPHTASHGTPWNTMGHYGTLWNTVEHYGTLWNTMDSNLL